MTLQEAERALSFGRRIGDGDPSLVAAFGEMGIGNTASASLIANRLTGLDLGSLVGRGTGLDDAGLARKARVLEAAASRCPGSLSPEEVLSQYGGYEIAMMTGAMLGAAAAGRIVLVDGFIATAAALVAERIAPRTRDHLVFAHVSAERGHVVLLEAMGARPLLALEMRLGEGTGALLAWPMVRAAAAMLCDMASFDAAGVSGPA
jgi:nicotinate-nucleotide--dimethylbenzimidazole phosphoribosyltransferase